MTVFARPMPRLPAAHRQDPRYVLGHTTTATATRRYACPSRRAARHEMATACHTEGNTP